MKLSGIIERMQLCYDKWGDLDCYFHDGDETLTMVGDCVMECNTDDDDDKVLLLTAFETRTKLTAVK